MRAVGVNCVSGSYDRFAADAVVGPRSLADYYRPKVAGVSDDRQALRV